MPESSIGRGRQQLERRRRGPHRAAGGRRIQRPAPAHPASAGAELDEADLAIAAFWLEHCDDAGYLDAPLPQLAQLASARFHRDGAHVEGVRQRLLHGEPTGMAACDLRECLQVQLAPRWPARCRPRHLANRLLAGDLDLLAGHDYAAIARVPTAWNRPTCTKPSA